MTSIYYLRIKALFIKKESRPQFWIDFMVYPEILTRIDANDDRSV